MSSLHDLAEGIRKCTACNLWKKRTLAVPGEGSVNVKIMFIGEAPGENEDRIGKPFVGRSGKFLDEMFRIADLSRKEVFITGAVKCHPSKNRNPTSVEVKTCRENWLKKQIELINPKLIVLMGNIAVKSLLQGKVGELHGQVIKKKYFVTFHPAAGMRFPKIRKLMEADFKKLLQLKRNL